MNKSASDLFIVDNSAVVWKIRSYIKDWCELSKAINFEASEKIGQLKMVVSDGKHWLTIANIEPFFALFSNG